MTGASRGDVVVGAPGRRSSGAGLALVIAALLGLGSLGEGVPEVVCPYPSEVASRAGWTHEVLCTGSAKSGPEPRGPARLLFGLRLDLNRADAVALQSLPGIGPRRAQAIVRARCERAFASLAELERIHGIGPRTVAGLQGWARAGASVEADESGVVCPADSGRGADWPIHS